MVLSSGGFNPQPPRRAAATTADEYREHLQKVSILSRPEERLQLSKTVMWAWRSCVSILSRPEERLQLEMPIVSFTTDQVSILSRPEERLQPFKVC